jgi:hypothetical protein
MFHCSLILTCLDVNLGFGEHLWEIQATHEITLLKVSLLLDHRMQLTNTAFALDILVF